MSNLNLPPENVITKNILSMYPGAAFYGLLFNILLMMDSIIAGQSLGAAGIIAVALGVPGYGISAAMIYSLIHGSGLRMIWAKGSTDDDAFKRAFNGGTTLVCLAGSVLSILIFCFAHDIILVCGGDMVDPAVRQSAMLYLRFCSPIVILTALGMLLQEVMNIYGLQNLRATLGAINVMTNLIVSILCVSFFPPEMKLAGLGIGTSTAGLAEFVCGIVLLHGNGVHLGYRPLILQPGEILETLKSGFPAAADYFCENIVMGIQNNLILAGFPGDPLILPSAELVCNISYFASGAIKGAAIATEPLFGIFYEEKDVSSIKKVWKAGWIIGAVMSVFWAALFYLALPLLSQLCGMELSPDISRGTFLCLIFAPIIHTVYMFTLYYEGTKHFAISVLFAVIPDSCLYILMMVFLIPVLGKDGIWLAITGNQLIGLLLLIPIVLLIGSKSCNQSNSLLLLPGEFFSESSLLEFEISNSETTAEEELKKLSAPIRTILADSEKAESMMRCIEDLVSDMQRTTGSINIKLKEYKEKAELYICGPGDRWELPSTIADDADLWGDNESITSSYVYKLTIVCITLAKR